MVMMRRATDGCGCVCGGRSLVARLSLSQKKAPPGT